MACLLTARELDGRLRGNLEHINPIATPQGVHAHLMLLPEAPQEVRLLGLEAWICMQTLRPSRGAVPLQDMAPATTPATNCFHHMLVSFSVSENSSGMVRHSPISRTVECFQKYSTSSMLSSECNKKWSRHSCQSTAMVRPCVYAMQDFLCLLQLDGNAQGSETLPDLRDVDLPILIAVQTVDQQ